MSQLLIIVAVVLSFLCSTVAASDEIVTIPLSMSNVHVLMAGKRPVLVDAGGKHDMKLLEQGLAKHGIQVEEVAAVIVTHGHSDHAALAKQIRHRSGAKIILGSGDVPMATLGKNDDLKPTNFTAKVLKKFFIDPSYEPFKADVIVKTELDLSVFGLAGKVMQMPGHTPGSLVVVLNTGQAFVGDMILGGWLGGSLFTDRAEEHYFHADLAGNRANLIKLLRLPINFFYLGHGGPVSRASVLTGFQLTDPR